MQKYNEFEKKLIDQAIYQKNSEEASNFTLVYEQKCKTHGMGILSATASILGIQYFYLGFRKFSLWSIILWILALVFVLLGVGLDIYQNIVSKPSGLFAYEVDNTLLFFQLIFTVFGGILTLILQIYMQKKTWEVVEDYNYELKEKLLKENA